MIWARLIAGLLFDKARLPLATAYRQLYNNNKTGRLLQ